MFPSIATLYMAPFSDMDTEDERYRHVRYLAIYSRYFQKSCLNMYIKLFYVEPFLTRLPSAKREISVLMYFWFRSEPDFWDEVSGLYKVDLTPLRSYSDKCRTRGIHIHKALPQEVLAHATQICHLDLGNVHTEHLNLIQVCDIRPPCYSALSKVKFLEWGLVSIVGLL